jgi:hypothetical protein
MSHDKRITKRELRLARKEQEQQATERDERRANRRRVTLIAVPVTTVIIAIGLYQFPTLRSAAGLTLLGGFLLWFALALGAMGSRVSSRDRGGASAIDYGKRR